MPVPVPFSAPPSRQGSLTLDDDAELHEQNTILLLLGNDTQFSVQKAHLRLCPALYNVCELNSEATTIPLTNTHEVSAGALAALLPHLPRWAVDGLPEKPGQIILRIIGRWRTSLRIPPTLPSWKAW